MSYNTASSQSIASHFTTEKTPPSSDLRSATDKSAPRRFNSLPRLKAIRGKTSPLTQKTLSASHIDSYMQQETQQLVQRLDKLTNTLKLNKDVEFKVIWRDGQLVLNKKFPGSDLLMQRLSQDTFFFSAFKWLQPNYKFLVISLEALEFTDEYKQSSIKAVEDYSYLSDAVPGLDYLLTLSHSNQHAVAQFETPKNIYHIENKQ